MKQKKPVGMPYGISIYGVMPVGCADFSCSYMYGYENVGAVVTVFKR